ncbi:MAG: undecaprenyl-phosphate glucose phosphotransferase [Ignavibacteriae bacterium HGW-Ignavibacteriae-3]|nr:MAG: undecaprenyl-phosphate glucose phosphotransferase [Ignavibacteriae bacterium HGW-Ignavibacteriae-3]
MSIYKQTYFFLRITADSIMLSVCFGLTYYMIPGSLVFKSEANIYLSFFTIIFCWLFVSNKNGIYDELRSQNFSYELKAIIKNCIVSTLSVVFVIILFNENTFPLRFLIIYPSLAFLFLSSEKYLLRKLINAVRLNGRNFKTMLIIGAGEAGIKFHTEISLNPYFSYKFLGFLDDKRSTTSRKEYLGPISNLEFVLESENVDNVMIALPDNDYSIIRRIVKTCERYPTRVLLLPDRIKNISETYSVTKSGTLPVIMTSEERISELHWQLVKRGFDIVFAFFSFVLIFSWLFPIIALIIKLDSKGPVFFKQERWGQDNRNFIIYKFRSMIITSNDLDDDGKYNQASKNDQRITRFGKFLRKSNLDELPQFWNVLKGEISIVGPRPHPTPLNIESKLKVDKYTRRHRVKPGITGWAQINGLRGETRKKSLMENRVKYDLWYIDNWSFWLDIQIIIMTIWLMAKGDENAY